MFQIVFFVWVTLNEQKWVTFTERRGFPLLFLYKAHFIDEVRLQECTVDVAAAFEHQTASSEMLTNLDFSS